MNNTELTKFYNTAKEMKINASIGYVSKRLFTEEQLEEIKKSCPDLIEETFTDFQNGKLVEVSFGLYSRHSECIQFCFLDNEPIFPLKKHFCTHKEVLEELGQYIPEEFL